MNRRTLLAAIATLPAFSATRSFAQSAPVDGADGPRISALLDEARRLDTLETVIATRDGESLGARAYGNSSLTGSTNIKSASKCVVSALVGIAIERDPQVGTLRDHLFRPKPRVNSLTELNAWLEDQCIAYARRTRHPEFREQTIWEVFQEERASLMELRGPFDGFIEKAVRATTTCLIMADHNRYSVDARAAVGAQFPDEFPAVFAACLGGGIDQATNEFFIERFWRVVACRAPAGDCLGYVHGCMPPSGRFKSKQGASRRSTFRERRLGWRFFFWDIGNGRFGQQQDTGHGNRIFQGNTHDFGRIDDAGFVHVDISIGGRIKANVARLRQHARNDHAGVHRRVFRNAPRRCFQGPAQYLQAGADIALLPGFLGGDQRHRFEQREAAAGDNPFGDRRAGRR